MEPVTHPASDEETGDETFPIIDEIELFIKELGHFITYADAVLAYPQLTAGARESTENMRRNITDIRKNYGRILQQESPEKLESRQDTICNEMDMYDFQMTYYEGILDQYLIYQDSRPYFRRQFDVKRLTLSLTAQC
jgi:hypothetical protein